MPKYRLEEDLGIINALTLVVILVVYVSLNLWLRVLLGFPFITFFPGYVLVAALFPQKQSLSGTERAALAFGLSIVSVVLIGIVLNYTPWHIEVHSILLSVSAFIWVVSGIAWHTRGRIKPEERFNGSMRRFLNGARSDWGSVSTRVRVLLVVIVLGVAVSGGVLGYHMANPDEPGEAFTEFYILGTSGTTADYPRELAVGEEGTVMIGITNHEDREVEYRLGVTSNGERLFEISSIRLGAGEAWEKTVGFSLISIGDNQEVEFTLCRDGVSTCERRYLRIDISE